MSLLVDITANALDAGYADASSRRDAHAQDGAAGGETRITRPAALTAALVLALAGALFATSAVATHRNAAAAKKTRAALLADIHDRTALLADRQAQFTRIHDAVTAARNKALSASGQGASLRNEIAQLEIVAGGVPVEGGGAEVTLDDAPPTGNAHTDSLGTIFDRDIQAVVDALFASGAEAISVNGQRLTSQTAIRQAGSAILVDYQPLSPPYRIDAIGPAGLADTFSATQTGTLYENWRQVYGLEFTVESRAHLRLPSAASLAVHYATPLESP